MVTTKGRYSLRVMIDLAQHPDGHVPLDAIAKRQKISKKYLEAIVKVLVQNNLVEGVRGKGGGYRLTKDASDYTVFEILEAAEGTLSVVSCLEGEMVGCERANECHTLPMWQRYNEMVRDFFTNVALQDVANEKEIAFPNA